MSPKSRISQVSIEPGTIVVCNSLLRIAKERVLIEFVLICIICASFCLFWSLN